MRKFDRNVKETISEQEEVAMKEALSGLCIDLALTQEVKKTEIRLSSEIEEITEEEYISIAKYKYDNNICTNEFEKLIGKYPENEVALELAYLMTNITNERRRLSAEKTAKRNNDIIKLVRSIVENKVDIGNAFLLDGMVTETERFINERHPRIVGKALEIMENEGLLKAEKRRIFMPDKTRIRKVYIRMK